MKRLIHRSHGAFSLFLALLLFGSVGSAQLTGDFTASVTSGDAPLRVRFTPTVNGLAISGSWDFGDGNTSTARSPLHTYSTPGTYTVSMTANGPSESITVTKEAYIVVSEGGGGGGSELVADFSATPLSGPAPLVVSFTAEVTGQATSGTWDFGDGGNGSGRRPSYTYNTPGTYDVSLTVTGPSGQDTATKTAFIVVEEGGGGGGGGLAVDFTATPTTGIAPLTVTFTPEVSGPATSGTWDFGDGTTDGRRSPVHVYSTPGTYTVQVTARGPAGSGMSIKPDLIIVEPEPDTMIFSNVNTTAGLDSMFTTGNTHTGGTAWVDYNNDFWPDLLLTNGGGADRYLYRNEGDGTFTNVSHLIAKTDVGTEDAGVKFADIDNDGDSDILIVVDSPAFLDPFNPVNPPEGGPNVLFENQGDGTFLEVAGARGVLDPLGRRNICAAFADYDRDGFVDLYIANWQMMNLEAQDNFDRMLRNDGTGSFVDVTGDLGTDGYGRDALVVLWFDADMDLWPDLYVGNVGSDNNPPLIDPKDAFYRNSDGTIFTDALAGNPDIGTDAWANMGMDVGDIDNDGDWDLYITDMSMMPNPDLPLGNPLYLGSPDGSISDNACDVAGVCASNSWPCNFADFNRDGWIDLWVGEFSQLVADYMYINNGDGTFSRMNVPSFIGNEARGGSVADYDGDGRVDIVIHNYAQDSVLLRNESTDTGGWVGLKLFGNPSNRDAIGATVRLSASGQPTQMRRVSGGDSAHSQSDLILHFGIADATTVDITIDWPSGAQQSIAGLTPGEVHFVDETDGLLGETMRGFGAVYDADRGELCITAQSSFGGRTDLTVEGLGDLEYDAASGTFRRVFEDVAQPPVRVEVVSRRGGSWSLPIDVARQR